MPGPYNGTKPSGHSGGVSRHSSHSAGTLLVLARKNSTVIQGTPAQRANQPPAANRPPQPHKTLGRRRVVLGLSLVALVLLGAIAYQGWKVVEAVVQAERSAVIPWPTRAASVAQV